MKRVLCTLNLTEDTATKLSNTIDKDGYISNLVERDLNRIIHFDNGFKYDIEVSSLYKGSDEEVLFTKTEMKLLKLLFSANGEVVTIDSIAAKVWTGKEMTRFTLRNKIKSLRDKTYYELIKSHSNIGYSINFPKDK